MPSPNSPSRFVVPALALTLLLAGVLGVYALLTARYHRSVAEGVLRDYAAFAAEELGNRVQTRLATRLYPVLNLMASRGAGASGGRLPPPDQLLPGAEAQVRALVPEIPILLQSTGADWDAAALHTAGAPVADSARRRLADSLTVHARGVIGPRAYLGLVWWPGDSAGRLAVYAPVRDSAGEVSGLFGFAIRPGAVAGLLEAAASAAPLLPPSLTGGVRVDSVVRFRISGPRGLLLQSPAPVHSPFAASRELGPTWGRISVAVALREDLADRLVIGGLPRSRLPLVLGLLALTTVLVLTAAVQLGRERELNRMREDFVAGVSHELRTPLAQIRLFAETLRLGRVRSDAERARSLEIIDQESRRLTHLVENLLHVSRAGRGTLAVAPRELDLAVELREAVEGFAPLAGGRRSTVHVNAPTSLTALVDGEAFRRIVLNLLDNAVKYGPEGQAVTVGLATDAGWARLLVDDQGPGVPPEARVRIFERFVRLDRDARAGNTGTGIGLAIVRELAELHGGRCGVEAAPSGGARFVVELPLGKAPANPGLDGGA